jgi:integrase/recombinase XerC
MLHRHINQFLDYCKLADFSIRSIQALTSRLKELENFLKSKKIRSIKRVGCRHLIYFAADFNNPSIHITKSRVWALHQFYHFLTLHQFVPENIATSLRYPKIEKTVPQYLTEAEYTLLLGHFTGRVNCPFGLRNLIIIMLLGTLGLRTATLTALNIENVDLTCGLLWVKEKGRRQRSMVLPHCICEIIDDYLKLQGRKKGPLLLSKRKKRISPRTLQDIFRSAADQLGIDKKLHARLFRHTAATQLNKAAGIEITQQVLGHSRRANTLKYTHLNPDQYAGYMKQHPFMRKEVS